jgi:hypothetical protein
VDKFDWLLTAAGRESAALARERLLEQENILRILKRMRKSISPAQAAMALELAKLQIRARTKFTRADEMLFTKTSLEQATSERLALYKASRFPTGSSVADICCGIGGDAIGLAPNRTLAAVDQQQVIAQMAQHNLAVYQSTNASVFHLSFEGFDISEIDCLHFDPDRRVAGRTVLAHDFSPPLTTIFSGIGGRLTGIKLAPATNLPQHTREKIHREFIGERRETKQQLVWLNHPEYPKNRTSCTVVSSRGVESMTFDNDEQFKLCEIVDQTGTYLYEPHSVVIAARMVNGIARSLGLQRVGNGSAYLTGDQYCNSALISRFRIESVVPLSIERVANHIHREQYGEIEWKKRAVEQETYEQLLKLKSRGERKITAVVTPSQRGAIVIFCQREVGPPVPQKVSHDPAKNET